MRKHTALHLRFPAMPDLHKKLVKEAKANRRSLNSEIIDRLQASFHAAELAALIEAAIDKRLRVHSMAGIGQAAGLNPYASQQQNWAIGSLAGNLTSPTKSGTNG